MINAEITTTKGMEQVQKQMERKRQVIGRIPSAAL